MSGDASRPIGRGVQAAAPGTALTAASDAAAPAATAKLPTEAGSRLAAVWSARLENFQVLGVASSGVQDAIDRLLRRGEDDVAFATHALDGTRHIVFYVDGVEYGRLSFALRPTNSQALLDASNTEWKPPG